MTIFSINNTFVQFPALLGGYKLSWIEALGTLAGLICIWLASKEKISNYLFGIINVLLFAIIFFQIQLYSSLLVQLFFLLANVYGWYAWSKTDQTNHRLTIRWLSQIQLVQWAGIAIIAIVILTRYIDPVFSHLTHWTVKLLTMLTLNVTEPVFQPDAAPFQDACVTVLSVIAMIMMTRKYVENWFLWVIINLISIHLYFQQGVYVMMLEYLLLTFIAINGARLWMKKSAAPQ